MLETIVPGNKEKQNYIFYGLSGSPSIIAHGYIIKLLSKIFPETIIVVVPVSPGYSKPPVKCVKGYLNSTGLDLRVATQLQMVADIRYEGGYDNVCVSLHEVRSPTGVGTYDSLKALRKILAELRGKTDEQLSLVVGADQTRSIAYRTWSRVLELLKELFEGKFNLLSFARGDIPFDEEKIKEWLKATITIDAGKENVFNGIPIYGNEKIADRTMTTLAGMINETKAPDAAKETEKTVSDKIASSIVNLSEKIAKKIAAMEEGEEKKQLNIASGELASADQVSSSKARKYWRRVVKIIKENIELGKLAKEMEKELLTQIIMAASDDEFPISRSIRTILLNYKGGDGVPYMSEDCEETKPIDPVGAAAVAAEQAAVAAVQSVLDKHIKAQAPPAGGRRRNRNRKQRKTQRKSRRRARNARRSRKQ